MGLISSEGLSMLWPHGWPTANNCVRAQVHQSEAMYRPTLAWATFASHYWHNVKDFTSCVDINISLRLSSVFTIYLSKCCSHLLSMWCWTHTPLWANTHLLTWSFPDNAGQFIAQSMWQLKQTNSLSNAWMLNHNLSCANGVVKQRARIQSILIEMPGYFEESYEELTNTWRSAHQSTACVVRVALPFKDTGRLQCWQSTGGISHER